MNSNTFYLFSQLVKQNLKLKYRRTFLGYVWSLLNPLLTIFTISIVFSSILKINFSIYLCTAFAGLIPWFLINQVAFNSSTVFISNEALIKKIYLPKYLFPLSIVSSLLIDSILSFIVLYIIFLIFLNLEFSFLSLSFLAVSYLIIFFFALGISFFISIISVFFRDLQWIIPVMFQALFFLTPILYSKELASGVLSFIVEINPLTPLIELFKIPILFNLIPSIELLLISILISLFFFFFGLFFFIKLEKYIIYRL